MCGRGTRKLECIRRSVIVEEGRGGGWYGERFCRAASLSRTEPRRYSTWNIDGMCQCVLMNRGDTRPPPVPRFFAVRKFDCRDRMDGGRRRRREKNSFPIDFYCLVIVRPPSSGVSSLFSFLRNISAIIRDEIIIYFILVVAPRRSCY